MGKKIFVGNLSFDTTSKDLETLFSQAGTCESVEGKVADEDLLAHLFSRSSPLMGRLWILSRLPGREADVGYAAGSRTNKRTRLVYHRSRVSCKRVPPGAGSRRVTDERQAREHTHVRRAVRAERHGREVVVVAEAGVDQPLPGVHPGLEADGGQVPGVGGAGAGVLRVGVHEAVGEGELRDRGRDALLAGPPRHAAPGRP